MVLGKRECPGTQRTSPESPTLSLSWIEGLTAQKTLHILFLPWPGIKSICRQGEAEAGEVRGMGGVSRAGAAKGQMAEILETEDSFTSQVHANDGLAKSKIIYWKFQSCPRLLLSACALPGLGKLAERGCPGN